MGENVCALCMWQGYHISETKITVEGKSTTSSNESMGIFGGLLGWGIIIVFVIYFNKLRKYNKEDEE